MILTGLPQLAPAEAHLRQIVPAALTGRRAGDAALVASIPAAPPSPRFWYAMDNGAAVALLRVDGENVLFAEDDGAAAAEALDRAEWVLRAIERGLGIALWPTDLVTAPPADALIAEVVAQTDGLTPYRLLLALPAELDLLPETAEIAPEVLGHVPLAVGIEIDGPRLAPHQAADLATGDLLLLGNPLTARLRLPGGDIVAGTFDPATQSFVRA